MAMLLYVTEVRGGQPAPPCMLPFRSGVLPGAVLPGPGGGGGAGEERRCRMRLGSVLPVWGWGEHDPGLSLYEAYVEPPEHH